MKPKLNYGQFEVIKGKDGNIEPKVILSHAHREISDILQQTDEEVAEIGLAILFEHKKSSGDFRISIAGDWSRTQIVGAIELIKHEMIKRGR